MISIKHTVQFYDLLTYPVMVFNMEVPFFYSNSSFLVELTLFTLKYLNIQKVFEDDIIFEEYSKTFIIS